MRSAFVVVVVLAACGQQPDPKHAGTGQPGGAGSGRTAAPPPGQGSSAGHGAAGGPEVAIKDLGCLAPTCAYHPGVNQYFTCLSGGAGTCFHFGAACSPEGACMYDASAKRYKTCTKPVEGQCESWGAACAPKSKCMFDPASGLHHACDDLGSDGACRRYGALCAP